MSDAEQAPSGSLGRFPAIPKLLDYPVSIGLMIDVVLVAALLVLSKRFDPTGGPFTIGLLIVVAFLGLTVYATLFNIPQDEETATVIGGLVAAFGAVVAFWLKNRN